MFNRNKRTDYHISYHFQFEDGRSGFGDATFNVAGPLTMLRVHEITVYLSKENGGTQIVILSITKLEG